MNSVILIPSLNPDDKLVAYVERLAGYGFDKIIVVNDGSSEQYDSFFERVAAFEPCTVLRHEVNRGKGAALKTGMRYYLEHFAGCDGIVTGDADGQHSLEDTAHLAQLLSDGTDALILGSRDFSGDDVPARSRFGNRTTSAVFKLTHGKWLSDTQTGLRAIPDSLVKLFSEIEGERFEYEMNMLIECADRGIPIEEQTIETIYLDENSSSHFKAVRDSVRIYWLILRNIIKYAISGLVCFLVDIGLFHLLDNRSVVPSSIDESSVLWAAITTFGAAGIARVCSSILNFTINKNVVFKKHGGTAKSALKFILLAVGIYLASSTAVTLLRTYFPLFNATGIKLVIDAILVIVSFTLQRVWVFKKTDER